MLSSLVLQQGKSEKRYSVTAVPGIIRRFLQWAEAQNDNRFVWLGIALLAHASLLTPLTAMTVMVSSGNFTLVMASLAAMALALVTNLAALPTKITIPAFFLSIAIDAIVIALSLTIG